MLRIPHGTSNIVFHLLLVVNTLVIVGLYGSYQYELIPEIGRVDFGWGYYLWAFVGLPFMFSTVLLTTIVCKKDTGQFGYIPR